ncbi:hypothetical protein G4O51_07720 [Candidatus Bathyarchaeota archaeon A05DMB-2]|nr:hypothetical protein [Candidatus Bathyarchaeota archaeon A05DMB-2]
MKNRTESDSYHGYAIQNFLDVDPRFGTLEELRKLVKAAHAKHKSDPRPQVRPQRQMLLCYSFELNLI